MTTYTLYKKTHNKTGLKYLGKTVKNPHKYRGSGKHWLRHLKKHGNDVITEVIFQTQSLDDFKSFAINYSIEHNIVESTEWANLILETGTGGDNPLSRTPKAKNKSIQTKKLNKKTWKQNEETKAKHRKTMQKYWNSDASIHRKNKSKSPFVGPPKPKSHLKLNNSSLECPYCKKTGQYRNMMRWHFDRCKTNPNRKTDKDQLKVSCIYCKYTSYTSPNFFKNHGNNCKLRP